MMRFIPFLLIAAFSFVGCDKSEVNKKQSFTDAVKTGNWMFTYFENTALVDVGITFIKFNQTGSFIANKDGTDYNGTWSETNTGGNNTVTINISTNDSKLKLASRTWKVMNITDYFIDLTDIDVSSKATVQLMKH